MLRVLQWSEVANESVQHSRARVSAGVFVCARRIPPRGYVPVGYHAAPALAAGVPLRLVGVRVRGERVSVKVTIYLGARAPEPVAQDELTWPELCDELEAMCELEYPDKLSMLAFAPHELAPVDRRTALERDGKPPAAGAYRHLANVERVTLLVIDVDRCNADVLAECIALHGEPAFMYASPSDDPDGPADARRVRVVAPISRPLTVAECGAARFAFAELLGLVPGVGVEGAKDAAKLFFVGRIAGTAPRQCWRFG